MLKCTLQKVHFIWQKDENVDTKMKLWFHASLIFFLNEMFLVLVQHNKQGYKLQSYSEC